MQLLIAPIPENIAAKGEGCLFGVICPALHFGLIRSDPEFYFSHVGLSHCMNVASF